jgi:hypothetical protein
MAETRVIGTTPATRRRSRLAIIAAFVLLGLGVAFFLTTAVLLHRAAPILRARVINTLSTRFDSRVELPELDLSGWNGLEVTGKGLKLYPHSLNRLSDQNQSDQDHDQPALSVGEFQFRTHWWNLLRSPMHIGDVHLSDLTIYRPSSEQREQMKAENNAKAQDASHQKIEIYVEEMEIDRATLVLGNDKPGKVPLTFNIHALKLHDVGAGQPLSFHAILVNPRPLGDIDSSGYFGPFDVKEPGNSPVRGNYTFSHADLSTIKGIGGMLSSTGTYSGKLDQIVVDGETETPNFSLDISGSRPVALHTRFHAIVDGMNGNTYLQPVHATLLHSHILATGAVTRAPDPGRPGQFGRHVQLQITVGPADIADMLRLAVKTNPPLMRGVLHLTSSFDLPPGPGSVAQRMRLKGRFHIDNATFSNPRIQSGMNQLSLRGEGHAEQADEALHDGSKAVPTAVEGDFTLGDAKLNLSGLHCDVPGADIAVDGIYSLDGKRFDLQGKARLQAKASQMVTGWRSLLLTPVDPLLSKNGAGVEVPFQVSGTQAEPKFGVDIFGHHFGTGKDEKDKKNQKNQNDQKKQQR